MRRLPAIALSLTTVAALSVACQNGKEPDSTGQPAPQTTSAAPTQTPTTTVTPKLVATQDSAGDPYVPGDGNGGYDVQHYDLKLKIVPTNLQKTLDGVAEIRAKANQELTAFNLDLTDLNVSEVKVNGAEASFDRAGSELVVKPSSPLPGGADFTVSVAYSGTPEPVDDPILGPYGWIKTSDGVVVACQPSGAHTWYPSNDHPSDKATFDIELTVPQKLTGISNGESGPATTSGGFTTTKWQVKQPMATYLATISVGDYKVKKGVTKGGIPILVAVDSSVTSTRIEDFYAHKSKITDEWVELFGEYPFDSTGGLVDNAAIGFALETQTRSVYGDFPVGGSIIAHELAHQWFGDSVSVTQWKDIWLNEGFASYAEWIWESKNGGASVQRQFDSYYQTPDSPNWRVLPGDPGRTQMFDTFAVYNRGAMTLHALRTKIGDDKFFELLRTWAKNYRYAYATTEQFVDLAEQISGSELSSFFQAWLYTPRRPQL